MTQSPLALLCSQCCLALSLLPPLVFPRYLLFQQS